MSLISPPECNAGSQGKRGRGGFSIIHPSIQLPGPASFQASCPGRHRLTAVILPCLAPCSSLHQAVSVETNKAMISVIM